MTKIKQKQIVFNEIATPNEIIPVGIDELGNAVPLPNTDAFSLLTCKMRTTFAGNINTNTQTLLPFNILEDNDDNTLYNVDNEGVIVKKQGKYEVFLFVSHDTNSQRRQILVQTGINSVGVGSVSQNDYIRNSSGHDTGTAILKETFLLDVDDKITCLVQRGAGTGNSFVLQGSTFMYIKRIGNSTTTDIQILTSVSPPDSILQGTPFEKQITARGTVQNWSLANEPSGMIINSNGLISYPNPVNGTYSYDVTASSSFDSDTKTYQLEVAGGYVLPLGALIYADANTAGAYSNGDLIPTWIDPISSNNLIQNNTANQPVYSVDEFGTGLNGVVFDGTGEFMQYLPTIAVGSTTQTVMGVVRINPSLFFNFLFAYQSSGGTNEVQGLFPEFNSDEITIFQTNPFNFLVNYQNSEVENQTFVFVYQNLGTTQELRINGASVDNTTDSVGALLIDDFFLGSDTGGFSSFDGSVAEFYLYPTALTPAQITDFETDRLVKYGI